MENELATIEAPEIMSMPPKMAPVLKYFNDYRYFCLEGGRSSGKTEFIARLILWLCDTTAADGISVLCGREIQESIELSVHKIFRELIMRYNLDFDITDKSIKCRHNNSAIFFKGFKEMSADSIKGLSNFDILWIDEAQSISRFTLDTIIPTIRKDNARVIFSMNRKNIHDPVYDYCTGSSRALVLKINYTDNPFCPQAMIDEARECKVNDPAKFNNIWLGYPLADSDKLLFNQEKLEKTELIEANGDIFKKQRVLGVDLAAGGDNCVATLLERKTYTHWELNKQNVWNDRNTMATVGRIINLISEWKPDIVVLDIIGIGQGVYDRIIELKVKGVFGFKGSETDMCPPNCYNKRMAAYWHLKEMIDKEQIIIKGYKQTKHELEAQEYDLRSNGQMYMIDKDKIKKTLGYSPDHADSLSMAVFGVVNYLGMVEGFLSGSSSVKRKNSSQFSTRR